MTKSPKIFAHLNGPERAMNLQYLTNSLCTISPWKGFNRYLKIEQCLFEVHCAVLKGLLRSAFFANCFKDKSRNKTTFVASVVNVTIFTCQTQAFFGFC